MCSLTIECVLLHPQRSKTRTWVCSLTTECVLLLQNVFSYYRMCSLTPPADQDKDMGVGDWVGLAVWLCGLILEGLFFFLFPPIFLFSFVVLGVGVAVWLCGLILGGLFFFPRQFSFFLLLFWGLGLR